MPQVIWLEGILDYFNFNDPRKSDDSIRIGYEIGQHIIGLYLIEMLLKHALRNANLCYGRIHSLSELFADLPRNNRLAAESKYTEILTQETAEAWDFESSVSSYLEYLGHDPFTDTRYFWERKRRYGISIIFGYGSLRRLVYALFVALHDYPERACNEQRFHTKFRSLEQSLEDRSHRSESKRRPNSNRENKHIKLEKHWLGGILHYFSVKSPHESADPRNAGFQIGQRIIGLYFIELLLKYGLDDIDRSFSRSHNLRALFRRYPLPLRRRIGARYLKVMRSTVEQTWDFCRSVERLLDHLGDNPLEETRYWWEAEEKGRQFLSLSPSPLRPLVYSLLIVLHDFPDYISQRPQREVKFLSLERLVSDGRFISSR